MDILGKGGGLTSFHLDSLDLSWTHLESLDFTWTRADSLGLSWANLTSSTCNLHTIVCMLVFQLYLHMYV